MTSQGARDGQTQKIQPSTPFARARKLLGGPGATQVALVAAAIVALPSLFEGLSLDDYVHLIYMTRPTRWLPFLEPPLDIFTFIDGNPVRSRWLIDQGIVTWWTDPRLRIDFFRPVSAATQWLDYQLWPHTPLLMHLQSIGWYLLAVALAAALYRRVIGAGWAAGLAAVLYAVDYTHGTPVGWLASRNALVSGAFALASLWLYARGRAGLRGAAWLSPLVLGVALLSGEEALGVTGYLAAYALFMDRADKRRAALSLVPHALVASAWLVAYRLGHRGVQGSGLYYDPLHTPLVYARHLVENLPLLFGAELGAPPPDVYPFASRSTQLALVAIAVGFLVLAAFAIVPLLRRSRVARFFLVGAALATLPACAVTPSTRTLLLPGFGLVGVVALAVHAVVERLPTLPSRGVWRAPVVAFAVWAGAGHVVLSPLLFQVDAFEWSFMQHFAARLAQSIPDDADLPHRRLVLVNAPDGAFSGYLLVMRWARGQTVPASLFPLAVGTQAVELQRTGPRTLLVKEIGGFFRDGTALLLRDPRDRMPVGTRVKVENDTVQVVDTTADGRPASVLVTFDHPLEDPSLDWVVWTGAGIAHFTPPPVGKSVKIPAESPLQLEPGDIWADLRASL